MAARRPPNAFSNELAVWIGDTYTSSIVFVELKPKDAKKLKHFWDVVSPILGESDRSGPKNDQRLKKCEDLQCCTGFVIRNTAGSLWILTCAHVLGPAFNNKRPITAAQVNDLFDLKILCDHNEQSTRSSELLWGTS
ncbi:hypothetical protein QOZ80_5BG0453250 [Eleusine coracana subsp. coracana]|nr:hypothetical protein QOZ80_5BG0453250 [Eleusine coracana subsp. coracana]